MFPEDTYFANFNAVYNFGGYFSIPAGDNWSLSFCSFERCKFYFITEGSCVITIEGTEYTAHAGDWFFIPAKIRHSYHNVKNGIFSKYWMHFDIYPDAQIFESFELPYIVQADKDGRTLRLFEGFAAALKGGRFRCQRGNQRGDKRFDSLLRYINENLHENLNNEILAQMYFAHPNHFIRASKKRPGRPRHGI